MPNSFSIASSRAASSGPALREEIDGHTGNDVETASILRSIERFGLDESIRSYHVTPETTRRTHHHPPRFTWSVRAVRDVQE